MEEEFLKKFVGKTVSIYTVGDEDGWSDVCVGAVENGILRGSQWDKNTVYIDIDGIMAILLCGEAIQDED